MILILTGFFAGVLLHGQIFLKGGAGLIERTVNKGDTVQLLIKEYRGTLQWQRSQDGSAWTDLVGQTAEQLEFIANEESYFRLSVISEDCDPVFSNVARFLVTMPPEDTFTDSRDGHVYKFVKIGTQTWMAENLACLPDLQRTILRPGRLFLLLALD